MQTLSDRPHETILHRRPVVDHLRVPDTDDVIPTQHEFRVMGDIGCALRTDMVGAVDLEDESLTDEEIDGPTEQPHLRNHRHSRPPHPRDDEGLKTGVGEGTRRFRHPARGRPERQS